MKKQIRKMNLLAWTAAMTLSLTACGGSATPSTSAPEASNPPAQSEVTAPTAPERTITYSMLLDGKETTVYLDVSDEEITLWDSASAGRIIAAAKYTRPMPGAAEALRDCDFTDLDEDGNSDLTAEFAFADGSTASLVWFYADGGLVCNEEFSRLSGEQPAAGTDEANGRAEENLK